ncbi:hypothetical protein RSAG8_04460, partial [Rhizoctonia solani AG-8 WAC10335]
MCCLWTFSFFYTPLRRLPFPVYIRYHTPLSLFSRVFSPPPRKCPCSSHLTTANKRMSLVCLICSRILRAVFSLNPPWLNGFRTQVVP